MVLVVLHVVLYEDIPVLSQWSVELSCPVLRVLASPCVYVFVFIRVPVCAFLADQFLKGTAHRNANKKVTTEILKHRKTAIRIYY